MSGPFQWIIAGALAIVLHGVVLGYAWTKTEISLEGSAGRPGSVWGLPVETIADTVDPVQSSATTAGATDTAKPVEQVETADGTRPVEADEIETASVTEIPDAASADMVVDRIVEAVPAIAANDPVEADQPDAPAWDGGIAVTATVPSVEAAELVEEVRVAALAPVSEVEAVEATDITIPLPPVRPEDVPRVTAPPPAPKKTVTRPAPKTATAKQTPKAATPAPSSNSARTASAPAGEQAGSSGARSAAAGRQMVTSYVGRVASHLQRHKRYPADTQRGQTGTATITFTIGSDGRVRGSRLSRSSGVNTFDREVLAMLGRAAPFPPIPPAIGKSSMTFTVPIRFRLR